MSSVLGLESSHQGSLSFFLFRGAEGVLAYQGFYILKNLCYILKKVNSPEPLFKIPWRSLTSKTKTHTQLLS